MRLRPIYALISFSLIVIGSYGFLKWGLPLGIDFKGGTVAEYRFEKKASTGEIQTVLKDNEVESIKENDNLSFILRFKGEANSEDLDKIDEALKDGFGNVSRVRLEKVGPSLGSELIKKTLYAITMATISILLWVAYQFKSVKFGTAAILAMLHDTLILIGLFAVLGHFSSAEADFLFVTSVLTTLSFSVHDTIVVFDRIREIRKKHGGSIMEIANRAISETMRRSINNSLTIIFVLTMLILLGGTSIRWFATALLIGTILGTYSSPFVAVPILVAWEKITKRRK
jgi:preprotein translocase subunit SecF